MSESVAPDSTADEQKKLKWTVGMDRTILIVTLGRESVADEYEKIRKHVTGQPTSEEIATRLVELRKEQLVNCRKIGLSDPVTNIYGADGLPIIIEDEETESAETNPSKKVE